MKWEIVVSMEDAAIMKIRDGIMDIIREMKPAAAPVADTSDLYLDLGFDSLLFVQLLVKIEEEYSISIEIMEIQSCLQAGRLVSLVESKVKEAGDGSPFTD